MKKQKYILDVAKKQKCILVCQKSKSVATTLEIRQSRCISTNAKKGFPSPEAVMTQDLRNPLESGFFSHPL